MNAFKKFIKKIRPICEIEVLLMKSFYKINCQNKYQKVEKNTGIREFGYFV